MRLNSLEIENITSLMGKHFIDFEEILKEGELFAITGPTGSGKSSILTAISLALYGKNYKKNLDSKDFVSLGSASANIKLNFQTKGNQYSASWSLKVLKKNGDPIKKPSPQRIVTKDGIAVEQTPEEIIGLTFDQFVRSVVLNQGQFSKFLTSNFSERRKILERLYSENELSEINKKLREKLSIQKQEIEKLTIKLDSSLPYSEDEIIEAEITLPEMIKEKNQRNIDHKDLQEIQSQLKDVLEFSKKRLQFFDKTKLLDEEIESSNKEVNKQIEALRDKNEAYESFKKTYTEKVTKLKNAISVRSKIESLSETIDSLIEKSEKLRLSKIEFEAEKEEKSKELTDLKKSEGVLRTDSSLTNLNSKEVDLLEEILSEITSIESSKKNHIENKKTKEIERIETEKSGKDLASILDTQKEGIFKIFNTDDFETYYQQNIEALERREKELDKVLLIADQAKDQRIRVEEELSLIDLDAQNKRLDLSLKKIKKFEEELKKANDKEKEYKKNEVLIQLVDQSIKEGECKVCSQSVEIEILETIKLDLEKDLKSNKGLIDTSEIQILITEEQSNLSLIKHEYNAKKERVTTLREEHAELQSILENSKEHRLKYEQLMTEKRKLQQGHKSCRELQQGLAITTQKITALRDEFTKIKRAISQYEESIQINIKKIDNQCKKITEIIKTTFTIDNTDSLKRNIKQTNELNKVLVQIESTNTLIKSLSKQLNNIELDKDETNLRKTKLSFECKELQKELLELTDGVNIDQALLDLEKERDTLESEIKECSKIKSQLETEYARLHTSIDSLKDQIKSLENSIMSALGNITNTNFNPNNLVSENKETRIFLEKIKCIKSYPENYETIEGLTEGNEKLLSIEINHLKERLNQLLSNISKNEEKISLYRNKEAEQTKDKSLLKDLKNSFDRLNNLTEVLGRNKDEFRNFVLGFIEQQLIQNTNLELSKICDGRYGLIQKESTHGHDFFITDRWNGAMERKVTTLSGGETFLVSLAMALTLAEMTRGQVDIDCFFIDEGFGSLDADSIEDAFSALMSVRSRGKQIGIISHIKELTSRIPANINLNKSAEGQSKIEYLYN